MEHADLASGDEWAPSREQSVCYERGPSGFWDAYDLIPCEHGKVRRVEPGTFPLATGVSARMGKLRAYGNAIVPQVAAVFIEAFLATEERRRG
jgi:DNA (cytosine-5)-methyltransferase 1